MLASRLHVRSMSDHSRLEIEVGSRKKALAAARVRVIGSDGRSR
jgi:hypothetical protein